jgi:DNA-binding CsgD family transcriptional regulator
VANSSPHPPRSRRFGIIAKPLESLHEGATVHHNNRGPISLWQIALYVAVLGVVSMLLAPLTAAWWIVPLLGAAMPLSLAVIQARAQHGSVADPAPAAARLTEPVLSEGMALPDPAKLLTLEASASPDDGASASTARRAAPDLGLSERELEVLALLATGQTNAEVAEALYISVGTVKSHSANIYRKLEAKNCTEAVARARELGVLP